MPNTPYVPYVSSSGGSGQQSSNPPGQNPTYSTPATSTGAYAPAVPIPTDAPAPAAGGYGASPGGNAPAPAPAASGGYGGSTSGGGYAPAVSISASSTTIGYGSSAPAPANNSYGAPSGRYAPATPIPVAAAAPVPPFSQSLNQPATYQPSSSSTTYNNPSTTARSKDDHPVGTSTAYGQPTGGAYNSQVYTGGPTHGLVSEGNPVHCHKIDYEIKGHDMQLVEVELEPQETVVAEASAMMFLETGIDFKAKFGDGSDPKQTFWKKLTSAGGRLLTGESLFMTHFTNQGSGKARVAFAAPYPGSILPINLMDHGQKLICQKDAFLCAAFGTRLTIHFNKRIGSGLFGGEGLILQKLKGDGMAFIHAGGTVIKKELRGEMLRLDTGCLVAFTDGINFDIQLVKGLKSMFFGGEGLFLATLQGTGTVWIQSLPFSRMADRIIQAAPSAGGRRQGEGSALTGGFGGLLDGDGF